MASGLQQLGALAGREISQCVVLTPPGGPDPATVASLEPLEVDLITVHDELIALAHLLLAERLDETRTAWGLRPAGCTVLLVESPEGWADLALVEGVGRDRADVIIIQLTDDGPGPMELHHPFRQSDERARDVAPNMRIDDEREPDAKCDNSDDEAFISADELAMLLGRDAPGEGMSGGGRP